MLSTGASPASSDVLGGLLLETDRYDVVGELRTGRVRSARALAPLDLRQQLPENVVADIEADRPRDRG